MGLFVATPLILLRSSEVEQLSSYCFTDGVGLGGVLADEWRSMDVCSIAKDGKLIA